MRDFEKYVKDRPELIGHGPCSTGTNKRSPGLACGYRGARFLTPAARLIFGTDPMDLERAALLADQLLCAHRLRAQRQARRGAPGLCHRAPHRPDTRFPR